VALVHAQDQPGQLKKGRSQPAASGREEVPPEEDTSLAVKEYSFNPLQAEHELKVGNFYFKTGKYRSAAMRFREATKWNENYSDAWLRLGETEEKLKDPSAAKEAYTKFLALASDAKNAAEIRKKLQKLR
jgi:tetratricopeptide (TPR) repeat protein